MSLCNELQLNLEIDKIENKQNTPMETISSNQYRGRDKPPCYMIDQHNLPLRYVQNYSKSPISRYSKNCGLESRRMRRTSKSPMNVHVFQNPRNTYGVDRFYVSMPFSPNYDGIMGSGHSYSIYNSQKEQSISSLNSLIP